jgi:SpoIID/LytB domain protein
MPIKNFLPILLIVLSGLFFFFSIIPARADELEDITKKLSDLTSALTSSKQATAPLESQLKAMQSEITDIKLHVAGIERDIKTKKASIDQSYEKLATQQQQLNTAVRDYYIKSYYDNPLVALLSATSASEITQQLAYQQVATDRDKQIMLNMALTIQDLEIKKQELENEEKRLSIVKASLDEQSAKLDKVVAGAKAYQSQLSSQIAQLSSQQQQLIAQKQGSLGLPTQAYTTSGGCSSDLTNGKDPGFGGGIGFFTYGVPHRVGMSQYGAKGRAEAGQSYNDILSAYFPNTQLSSTDQGKTIHVVGTNEYGQSFDDNWSIEEYVKHIYEIPSAWPANALKAQAIAARSYALALTNNGDKSICPSQSCQVVKKELNADSWVQAVNDTAGQILTSNGSPIQAWFSSTAGGYTFSSGAIWGNDKPWTKSGPDASGSIGSFADLQANAYDKASPWFYCDWGGRSSYGGTAWLKPDEVADIANVILLARKDSSLRKHLYQPDKANPEGTDTWDGARVRQELGSAALASVSDISVSADFGAGKTTTVTINGQNFPADEFKNWFNLRAPANINIVGSLYNVEKK